MLTDSATRIVSLTITEGGHNVDDNTGQFEETNAGVQDDAHRADAPRRTACAKRSAADVQKLHTV